MSTPSNPFADPWTRFEDRVSSWGLTIERSVETETSLLGFGQRGPQPIVLKVVKRPDDEWRSGEMLSAYQGCGVVRVHDWVPGAMLIEWLRPATPLVSVALRDDDEATKILAHVVFEMSPRTLPGEIPTLHTWGAGFDRYLVTGDQRLPTPLVAEAQRIFQALCRSQKRVRLLHGDLHHYNVLLDQGRGWIAIDPKGVLGEIEYEVGAALRNPYERPDLFADRDRIRMRIERFVEQLNLDADRVTAWAFAQAILAAIWLIEDGSEGAPLQDWLTLAKRLRPMLPARLTRAPA